MSSSSIHYRQMGGSQEHVDPMPNLTILVIDDSKFARSIIKNILCSFGFIENVIEFDNAVDGMELLKSGHDPINLVLLDNEMPMLTGEEFTRTVRRDPNFPESEIPIIMISCHTDQPRVVAARNAGINEFLAKPFSAEDLYQRISLTIFNPRPFIRAKNYVGPDRRWIKDEKEYTKDRRGHALTAPLKSLQKNFACA